MIGDAAGHVQIALSVDQSDRLVATPGVDQADQALGGTNRLASVAIGAFMPRTIVLFVPQGSKPSWSAEAIAGATSAPVRRIRRRDDSRMTFLLPSLIRPCDDTSFDQ
jgi:hypothetical protein